MKLEGTHVGDMLIGRGVAVIRLNYIVKEIFECNIRVFRSSITAYTRVNVFTPGEDTCFERDASRINFVVVLLPDLLRQVLTE